MYGLTLLRGLERENSRSSPGAGLDSLAAMRDLFFGITVHVDVGTGTGGRGWGRGPFI